uniref:EF-hand domain-containing protein n=1 Tax=Leptocylindrus danicus TaxID=163516 RepID=A0A7S2LGF3_9STRA|mmetsp:Transcript_5368/g.7872  ORF Transcript_5368/g.7872 Transcript_5368/m.7872 type:complete len:786 (+) Transcript_5368:99-2456(+)|eukprot:CAMPEP_0116020378 /NCGR_PEP_ID=MMETSP0321-20121206/9759_1 /TAXON_ID=163516 /ORGANISM="Leptocylindrus danicus var. danicus, Strain B650" /LENGTH=785 /DNA_ID=CAMNT_0003491053 /DNA_START=74 /DNA_END=2431 /DNA_ORIENTATION=+
MSRISKRKKGDGGRGSITILVLGDEGAGKSSLVSTFVSRHFSERVPGVMTRVRLPITSGSSEGRGGSYVTTIVDTQNGDATLAAVASTAVPSEPVDAIVLVYDLDRPSTFQRLESHWLPLIERCYSPPAVTETPNSIGGPEISDYNKIPPVIIAGNKLDLSLASPAHEDARLDRQQIVALLGRFKFVRQCIKTSAKTLLNVNDIFDKAQQAVLYPIGPLFDLTEGKMTDNCCKAFTRIFRMFDEDKDGLLNDLELGTFQNYFFKKAIHANKLTWWKKVLSKKPLDNDEVYIQDDKFTVAGFLTIIEMFMLKEFFDVPWRVLRHFGYDDDLNLYVPDWVVSPSSKIKGSDESQWSLSASAVEFLESLFTQFDSNNDGELTEDDIKRIFSIVPHPSLPPWHPTRTKDMFEGCFSVPCLDWYKKLFLSPPSSIGSVSSDEHAGVTILSSHDTSGARPDDMPDSVSSPTMTPASTPPESLIHPPLKFVDWSTYWFMVSSINPVKTRMELYRLGYDNKMNAKQSLSRAIRIKIFGSSQSGKTALLNALVGANKDPLDTEESGHPETRCTHVYAPSARLVNVGSKAEKNLGDELIHMIFTEVPEVASTGPEAVANCELAMLVFDCNDERSYEYVHTLEERLSEDMPRVFIGTKKDTISAALKSDEEEGSSTGRRSVLVAAQIHCEELDLEPPTLTSVASGVEAEKYLTYIALCAVGDLRSKPYAAQKRKEALWRRRMLWLSVGGISLVGVAAVGYFWRGEKRFESILRSFKNLFGRGESSDGVTIPVGRIP